MPDPLIQDQDLTIYLGDAKSVLAEIPDGSVDCVVTSPPYWGLRDYGQDGQLGLEPTPEQYVKRMVEVFREVRRVLTSRGTCWVNLGDSYASQGGPQVEQTKQHVGSGYHGTNRNIPGLKPKDLVGIPWRVAFALQADGWYLRSDIIWSKPNPMPESVTDRPTKAHEYLFLLSKQPRYFFDQEAVREPAEWNRWGDQTVKKYEGTDTATGWMKPKTREELNANRSSYRPGQTTGNTLDGHEKKSDAGLPVNPAGRNVRSVWTIATQPYADAHFATFPIELPRRAISAGCPPQVCRDCGQPRTRIVERDVAPPEIREKDETSLAPSEAQDFRIHQFSGQRYQNWLDDNPPRTVGWTDCGHDNYRTGVVLDPFFGAGTTALAARSLNRHAIGIEINSEYCEIAATRLQQLSLLSDVAEA